MTEQAKRRKPAAFSLDEAVLSEPAEPAQAPSGGDAGGGASGIPAPTWSLPSSESLRRGLGWGAILLSAASALASLAAGLWFARFVSIAVERQDWIGFAAFVLAMIVAVAMLAILAREVIGFLRLARLSRLKESAARALREGDRTLESAVVRQLRRMLGHRPELRWGLARLSEHERDVHDAGDLFRLADRELLAPLDLQARRIVAKAARRVSVATAISPAAVFAVGWVLVENLRLLRSLAGLYGGRPGFVGTARLARMVFAHVVATGGVALTDDLLGQFLGQDLVRRLSRRLGEGIFNGALTARIGAAAIEVTRPLPFLDTRPVRARDFLAELTRRSAAAEAPRAG
jgi:putative membrane protein